MSEIILGNVIVHRLIKEQHKDFDYSKPYICRKAVLDRKNDIVIKLVTSIAGLYGKKSNNAHYGVFKSDPTKRGPFPELFNNYLQETSGKLNKEKFVTLSNDVMRQLFEEAKSQQASSGGYLLFADYISNSVRYFLIAMIKQKDGIIISEKLEPSELEHLDLSKLNQAARISFKSYTEYLLANDNDKQELNYLSFVSPSSNQTTSGYFITALGCDKGTASAKATSNVVSESFKFFNGKAELKVNAKRFRQNIIDYLYECMEKGESVKLSSIEGIALQYMPHLNDDIKESFSKELYEHLNSEAVRVPTEFKVSPSKIKDLRNIKYISNNLSFEFNRYLLGDNEDAEIYYNKNTGHLTLTRLPAEKKSELSQMLDEKANENNIEDKENEII